MPLSFPHPRRAALSTATAMACVLTALSAGAQTATWTGAVDGDFNTDGNWSTGVVPNGNPAVLDQGAGIPQPTQGAGQTNTVQSMTVDDGTLTVGGAMTATNGFDVNADTVAATRGILNVTGAGALTGDVANAGTFTIADTGSVTGTVTNADGGVFDLGLDGRILTGGLTNEAGGQATTAGDIAGAVANSGTLGLSAGALGAGLGTTAGGTTTVTGTVSVAGNTTVTGAVGNAGALSVAGGGALTADGAVDVGNGGTLTVQGGAAATTNAALDVRSGATLTIQQNGVLANTGAATVAGTADLAGQVTGDVEAVAGGRVDIASTGRVDGTLTVGGSPTVAGAATIAANSGANVNVGTLVVNAGGDVTSAGRIGVATVGAGGDLTLSDGAVDGALTLAGPVGALPAGAVAVTGGVTVAGDVSGAGDVTVSNGATLTLAPTAALTNADGGTLTVEDGSTLNAAREVALSGAGVIDGRITNDLGIEAITGDLTLGRTGSVGGTLRVAGDATLSGDATDRAQVAALSVQTSGDLESNAAIAGDVTSAGETSLLSGSVGGGLTVQDGGDVDTAVAIAGNVATAGVLTLNGGSVGGTTTVQAGGDADVEGTVAATGAITVERAAGGLGAARLDVGGAGDLTANAGITTEAGTALTIADGGRLASTAATGVTLGGTADVGGTLAGTVSVLSGGDLDVGATGSVTGGVTSLGDVDVAGSVGVLRVEAGTAALRSAGTVQGATTVAGGTLTGAGGTLAGTTDVQTGGTLSLTGAVAGSGAVINAGRIEGTGSLDLTGTPAATLTSSGVVDGNVTLSADTIALQAGSQTGGGAILRGAVGNAGTLTLSRNQALAGDLTNGGSATLSATIDGAGNALRNTATASQADPTRGLAITGQVTGLSTFANSGTTSVSGRLGAADVRNDAGTLTLTGRIDGAVANAATLRAQGIIGGVVDNDDLMALTGDLRVDGTLSGDGDVLVGDGTRLTTTGTDLSSGGVLTLGGTQAIRSLADVADAPGPGQAATDARLSSDLALAGGALVARGGGRVDGTVSGPGTITMQDGRADGRLTVGSLTGEDTILRMDTDLADGATDRIVVRGGATTGRFLVALQDQDTLIQGSPVGEVLLIDVDSDRTDNAYDAAFDLSSPLPSANRLVFRLNQRAAGLTLESLLNPQIAGIAGNVALTQSLVGSLINRPSSPFVVGLAVEDERPCGAGLWSRGQVGSADASGSTTSGGATLGSTIEADFQGVQLGGDFACFQGAVRGFDVALGAIAGYNRATTSQPVLAFDVATNTQTSTVTSRTEGEIDQLYAGLYAALVRGAWSGDLQLRYEDTSFTFDNPAGLALTDRTLDTDGVTLSGSVSRAFTLPADGWSLVPTVGFSVTRNSGGTLTFDDGSRLDVDGQTQKLGFAGATVAKTRIAASGRSLLNVFGTATYYGDFTDDLDSRFTVATAPDAPQSLSSAPLGDYGEISAGVNYVRILDGTRGRQFNAAARLDYRTGSSLDGLALTAQVRWQF
ncbi:hypothetical protein [Jannaschia sp. LMIT008]|uniref:beta strand repeat-containing protein n=1 Tax=Jannaschia maritima TaxID=3032585 RepID=UPI0028112530|nr:hypothetical protein [Jannaschia sp. LMIT008]